jgi:arsenate reductase (thioredoxin)
MSTILEVHPGTGSNTKFIHKQQKKNYCRNIFLPVLLLISIFSFGQPAKHKNKVKQVPSILFVCEHGAARSTIAAAYFNKLAKEQGLNYQAVFRGTYPDSVLSPGAKKGLIDDGFVVSSWIPKLVSQKDISNASQIVTFDCMLPLQDSVTKQVTQWNGIPSISKDYNLARNQIAEKVQQMIDSLAKMKIRN